MFSIFVLHNAAFQSTGRLDPRVAVAAEAMIGDCQGHGVECRFFLSPLHADVLYALYHLNLWPEVEKLKRTLAALAPTYDFTRYNHLIDERTGPVVHWPEAFHFAPALGKLMAEAMTGARTANMPENFGVMLDAGNIEASLAAWREERDAWIAQHPDSVRRCERRRKTFEMAPRSGPSPTQNLGAAAGRSDLSIAHSPCPTRAGGAGSADDRQLSNRDRHG